MLEKTPCPALLNQAAVFFNHPWGVAALGVVLPRFRRQHHLDAVAPGRFHDRQELGSRAEKVQAAGVGERIFKRPPEPGGDSRLGQCSTQRPQRNPVVVDCGHPSRRQEHICFAAGEPLGSACRGRLCGSILQFGSSLHIPPTESQSVTYHSAGGSDEPHCERTFYIIGHRPAKGQVPRRMGLSNPGSCPHCEDRQLPRRQGRWRSSCRRRAPIRASGGPRRDRRSP